jgi:hypothetical protein
MEEEVLARIESVPVGASHAGNLRCGIVIYIDPIVEETYA